MGSFWWKSAFLFVSLCVMWTESGVLPDSKECIQKYRDCLQQCNEGESTDYCESSCQQRYPCDIGECPMMFRGSCLFLPNIKHDCNSDSDCPYGKKCCRFGDLGCIKICIDTRIDISFSSVSNPYRRMDWNLPRKTNLGAGTGA